MFVVVDRALDLARAQGASSVEVYAQRATSRRIKVYEQQVEELTAARRKGIGVRVFTEGAVGYAYTSDTSDASLAETVARAIANARVSDSDEFAALPEPQGVAPQLEIYDPRLAGASDADKIEIALALERAALEHDARVKTVDTAIYADGDAEIFIANTAGVRGSYRTNECYTFAYVLAEQDGQVETGDSYSIGRDISQLEPARCGAEAAQRACDLLGARKCASMKATVVLDPFVAAAFIGVLSSALTADAVQKGRSLFATLEGSAVAGTIVNLTDDGVHRDGLASAPFDGEGTPCRRTPLIEGGVLRGFLYDTYTGRKAGRASTGNGLRPSYVGTPSPRPTNLVVEGSKTPLADIIGGVEHGVLVTNAVGVHSGANPVSGEFSIGISGRLIESGRLSTPVREVTLAGDIISMLKNITALADDARWVPSGSILTPSLVIEGMSIGGV
jgi:PmbA protein